MNILDQLIGNLAKLPGIGGKSASRIAYHLLGADHAYNQSLSTQIAELQKRIHACTQCGNYTETDPCPVCTDPTRDRALICVVEQSQDVHNVEATREFNGLYHVLHGVISPIDGVGPEQLRLGKLADRIREFGVRELIIATNPTVEGDTTALYIARMLKDVGVSVSRLASGLPVGGDLEYADRLTLARSLKGRVPLD